MINMRPKNKLCRLYLILVSQLIFFTETITTVRFKISWILLQENCCHGDVFENHIYREIKRGCTFTVKLSVVVWLMFLSICDGFLLVVLTQKRSTDFMTSHLFTDRF